MISLTVSEVDSVCDAADVPKQDKTWSRDTIQGAIAMVEK